MVLLDTNLVSELRKVRSGKADPGVAAWAERVDAACLFLSAVSLHEPELGVRLMERRDGFIAATALVHSLVVVTRNVADFEASGSSCSTPGTWWDESPSTSHIHQIHHCRAGRLSGHQMPSLVGGCLASSPKGGSRSLRAYISQ
jgi:hypothetical protein